MDSGEYTTQLALEEFPEANPYKRKIKSYSMLERFIRRFQKPREWRDRLYLRYLTWCSGQISRGNLGRHIPRSKVRDMGLEIRNFNRS